MLPPAIVAAVSLYLDLPLTLFFYTWALSGVVVLLLVAPHSRLRWALAAAIVVLGLVLLLSGINVADWATAAFAWVGVGSRSGA
jgi:hypothetical protein